MRSKPPRRQSARSRPFEALDGGVDLFGFGRGRVERAGRLVFAEGRVLVAGLFQRLRVVEAVGGAAGIGRDHFAEKVPSPLRRSGHSALTVTVEDLEGLTRALGGDGDETTPDAGSSPQP